MPQLDPSPWFFIFLFSWTTFLIFSTLKTSKYTFPNDPFNLYHKNGNKPWSWPWP
uniref:ATP synthase complex subunit 8 n=1 Tax=Anomaloglossus surinamensis TaxID=1938971 RepID=A0A343X7R6_9NEOB|nr:ATP synthase F0 subunit 8 [Anomaloglossus surinamensis]AWG47104.1 ATP synthase F0 subunit 8 [Anomaloglossus surinamensis]